MVKDLTGRENEADRLDSVIIRLEEFATFANRPAFGRMVQDAVEMGIAKALSPFVDRAGAAAMLHCSPAMIDLNAEAGVITRYRAGDPLFSKSEIETAVKQGRWLSARAAREKITKCRLS